MQEMIIQDNNPNLILFFIFILGIIFILCNIAEILIKWKRMKELEKLKRELQDRHDEFMQR